MRIAHAVIVCSLAGIAAAQQQVSINLSGVQFKHNTNQSRSSAPNTISPAFRYHYSITGSVRGYGGALALAFPNPTPIATVLETLSPGTSALLNGDAENCSGTLPYGVPPSATSGSTVVSGITVNYGFTLTMGLDAAGVASFSLTNVTLSPTLIGYLQFENGAAATLTRVAVCPANCDNSTTPPILNVQDFSCFLNKFAAGETAANCDCSTTAPTLNVQDFSCFINRFANGCPL